MLTSAALVFLMTPGVAFFYGGMVRAKAVLTMLMLSAEDAMFFLRECWQRCYGQAPVRAKRAVAAELGLREA